VSHVNRKETACAKRVELHTTRYFLCPSCEKHEFVVEHLFDGDEVSGEREVGPWQCDECDATWMVHVRPGHGTVDVAPAPQRSWHNWDILEFAGTGNTVVRLVVPGLSFERERRLDEEFERKKFYYEGHTCPINYLHSAAIVASGDREHWGEDDPHGLFRFVATFEHALRPHLILSSHESDRLGEHAWKTLAKLGRS
jgi:transcription elongation factor Elf1